MKLSDCRESYQYFSGETSKIARKLAFVGYAIIWIFKGVNVENKIGFHLDLAYASLSLIFMLIFDLLHYIWGSIAWGIFNRFKEYKKTKEKDKFKAPKWINWPTNFFFWFKLVFLAIAYYSILKFLGYNIFVMQ